MSFFSSDYSSQNKQPLLPELEYMSKPSTPSTTDQNKQWPQENDVTDPHNNDVPCNRNDDYNKERYRLPPVLCSYIDKKDNGTVFLPVGAEVNYYTHAQNTKPVKLTSKYYVCPELEIDSTGEMHETKAGYWTETKPTWMKTSTANRYCTSPSQSSMTPYLRNKNPTKRLLQKQADMCVPKTQNMSIYTNCLSGIFSYLFKTCLDLPPCNQR